MKDPVFPIAAGLASLMMLPPLLWHLRARNCAIISLIAWIFLANILQLINAAVWWSSTENKAPVWCDISTRLYIMSALGVPCATWRVAMHLEGIASTRQVSEVASTARRKVWLDAAACIALPIIYAACAIVWQGHRFDIYEGMGCYTSVYYSVPWLLLSPLPILFVSAASLFYSVLAFRWFLLRRRQFVAVLASSGSSLNESRYLRMMAFCSIDMLITVPFTAVNMTLILSTPLGRLQSYTSWADVHFDFGQVTEIPASAFGAQISSGSFHRFNLTRWSAPVAGFLFFAIFGLTKDAVTEYRRVGSSFLACVTRKFSSDDFKQRPSWRTGRSIFPVLGKNENEHEHELQRSVRRSTSNKSTFSEVLSTPSERTNDLSGIVVRTRVETNA